MKGRAVGGVYGGEGKDYWWGVLGEGKGHGQWWGVLSCLSGARNE